MVSEMQQNEGRPSQLGISSRRSDFRKSGDQEFRIFGVHPSYSAFFENLDRHMPGVMAEQDYTD